MRNQTGIRSVAMIGVMSLALVAAGAGHASAQVLLEPQAAAASTAAACHLAEFGGANKFAGPRKNKDRFEVTTFPIYSNGKLQRYAVLIRAKHGIRLSASAIAVPQPRGSAASARYAEIGLRIEVSTPSGSSGAQ